MGKTKKYKKKNTLNLPVSSSIKVSPSEPVAPVLWRFDMRGGLSGEGLPVIRWRGLGEAVDPRVAFVMGRLHLFHNVFRFLLLDRKWCGWGRSVCLGFDVFEVLQMHHLPALSRARQQHRHVLAELGAHAEVNERIVEAGRLGEETRHDAGCAGHMEAPGWPHRHHGIWRPGHDESRADHNGNLGRNIREQLSVPLEWGNLTVFSRHMN